MEKIVYIGMSADFLHHGHLRLIKESKKYGEIIIGLLTDKAMASYKRLPFLTFEERKEIIENIVGVKSVIAQETLDYTYNLKKIKPDFVAHGDDWKDGVQKDIRQKVIETLKIWGGELLEFPYTKDISSTKINNYIKQIGTTPSIRMKKLKRLIESKEIVRILEAHNGLTGLIVENANIIKNNKIEEFDGIWISSLTDSTAKGKPDIELVKRMDTLDNILDCTTKPIIVDGDTGGIVEHFKFNVRTLERLGVSAIIIEDKIGLKKNSLFEFDNTQEQDTIENFCFKISEGKKSQVTQDFMIISRIESFILNKGLGDAIKRSVAYINAGADGIMIHSNKKNPNEIIDFCKQYKKIEKKVPLIVVPTSYSQITENELSKIGVNVVIYANHLLRSAYPSMLNSAKSILQNKRAYECDEQYCMPIKDIINLIPER